MKLPSDGIVTPTPWNAGQSGDGERPAQSINILGPLNSKKWVEYSILCFEFGGVLISHLYSPVKSKVLWKPAQSTFMTATEEAWCQVRWALFSFALVSSAYQIWLDVCMSQVDLMLRDSNCAIVLGTSRFVCKLSEFLFLSSSILLIEADKWRRRRLVTMINCMCESLSNLEVIIHPKSET